MNRIVILLIASFALVNCQSNVSNNTNSTTTETPTNGTTITTTLATNGTSEPPTTPNITSTPVPTTVPTTASTPTPTTPPKPSEWNGNVTEDDNTCINVKFAVEIKIKYNNTNNTETTAGFNIPVNARVDERQSRCSPNSSQLEVIVIRFDNEEYTSANLTLRFNETGDNVVVEQIELSFNLTKELFPLYPGQYNKIVTARNTSLNLFGVAKVHSYVCDKAQTASLEAPGLNGVQIEFTESKVQAFIDKNNKGKFDSEINCKSTEISDVVPIAVGAALAGLVVIVLIAYFIGRRRSRRLAYQSV